MKPMIAALALALCLAGPIAAEEGSWTGQLADAACKAQDPQGACPVDESTRAFGIVIEGVFAPFDSAGNAEAAKTVQAGKTGNPTVTVSGDYDGQKIAVESIR